MFTFPPPPFPVSCSWIRHPTLSDLYARHFDFKIMMRFYNKKCLKCTDLLTLSLNLSSQPVFYSLAALERDTFVWLSYPTNWRLDKLLWKRPLQEIRYKEDAKLPFERTGHIQQQVAQPLNGLDISLWIFQSQQKWRQLVQGIWVVWINQGARKASPVQIQIESWKTFFSSLVRIHICSDLFFPSFFSPGWSISMLIQGQHKSLFQ